MIEDSRHLLEFISSFSSLTTASAIDESRDMLKQVRCGELLPSILKIVLRDPELLNHTASMSYSHSNGFDKIVLAASDRPPCKLRMHVWWPQRDEALYQGNIHNHRWSFISSLVKGELRIEEFTRIDGAGDFYHYSYSSPEDRDYYSMHFAGLANLNCMRDQILHEEGCYGLQHTTLHRVTVPANRIAVTLLLQGPVMNTVTDVFTLRPIKEREHVPLIRFSLPELSERLRHVLDELEP